MTTLIFDIETNGFLKDLDTIHSLVIKDVESGEVYTCCDDPSYDKEEAKITSSLTVKQGVEFIADVLWHPGSRIVGHNIISFDIPAIQKVFPWFEVKHEQVTDTLMMSRMIWPDIVNTDMNKIRKGKTTLPPKLAGAHKLEAWGHRLGEFKGDYMTMMEEKGLDPWASWNPEMQEYCEQDVVVTEKLWNLIQTKDLPEFPVWLEHEVEWIIAAQVRAGFAFDADAAEQLYVTLASERAELEEELRSIFKPWYSPATPKPKTPKRDNRRWGYVEGCSYTPVKLNVFNPNSNDQIENRLRAIYGWKPVEMTPSGKAKLDETILEELPYPEAKELGRFKMIQKRIGQIAEGNQAWLKKVEEDGRIHGNVISCGTPTARATHSNPNISQVPGSPKPFWAECRGLFGKVPGRKLLGCDVSGLELRMLAHYMAKYDKGAYGREVIDGDIHTLNQEAAGLPTRGDAKTFIYAFLYGAGDFKIGTIIGKGARAGKAIKAKFFRKVPALRNVIKGVQTAAKKRKRLKGLDGRSLQVRSQHAALNTLLQAAGAIVCKLWMVEFHKLLKEEGLTDKVTQVAWIHDEIQLEVDDDLIREDGTSIVGDLCVNAIVNAGNILEVRVPLTGEYKIGNNWAETH